MKNLKDNNELTYGRIESAKKSLAKVLNEIEELNLKIKCACSLAKWDDEVSYQIDEAATKLGYALATLTTWNDCDEKCD